MADLITLARAKEAIPNFPSADDTVLQHIVSACSGVIERYCNRVFEQATYDELYSGNGYPDLRLDHFPLISIARVAIEPTPVLRIRNTNTANSRATVRVTSTGLTLTSVASAVTTTTSLAFATYTTVSALATAVAAVSGWTATASSPHATWASADLRAIQGALNAVNEEASLFLHVRELSEFHANDTTAELFSRFGWPRGYRNVRVVYDAGFASVPEAIQQACAELCAHVYHGRGLNTNLQSESLGGYSYTMAASKGLESLSAAGKQALALYRVIRVPPFRQEGGAWPYRI